MHYALYNLHFAHKRYVGASIVLLYSEKFSATLRQQLTPEENRGGGEGGSLMWDPPLSKKVIELKTMENVFQLLPYESQVEMWGL